MSGRAAETPARAWQYLERPLPGLLAARRDDLRAPLPELPPRCECGGLLRPGVVWFGESLPPDVWRAG